jgi:hypothetical protein
VSTITDGIRTAEPLLVIGRAHARATRTTVHQLIGTPDTAVVLQTGGLRRGELQFLCADLAQASLVQNMHLTARTLTLDDTDQPSWSMTYVTGEGEVRTELDNETLRRWVVTVPFQEIAP